MSLFEPTPPGHDDFESDPLRFAQFEHVDWDTASVNGPDTRAPADSAAQEAESVDALRSKLAERDAEIALLRQQLVVAQNQLRRLQGVEPSPEPMHKRARLADAKQRRGYFRFHSGSATISPRRNTESRRRAAELLVQRALIQGNSTRRVLPIGRRLGDERCVLLVAPLEANRCDLAGLLGDEQVAIALYCGWLVAPVDRVAQLELRDEADADVVWAKLQSAPWTLCGRPLEHVRSYELAMDATADSDERELFVTLVAVWLNEQAKRGAEAPTYTHTVTIRSLAQLCVYLRISASWPMASASESALVSHVSPTSDEASSESNSASLGNRFA